MALRARLSNSLTFADYPNLMKAITKLLCNTLLQEDLQSVIQWSIANNMLLHQDKFVMNYCLNAWSTLRELPFTADSRKYCSTNGLILEAAHCTHDLGVYL
jgi:hypothetical protein